MRDVRHEQAVAAPDLADYLVALSLGNKSPKTIYEYTRQIAPLLRTHPEKTMREFTAADINAELFQVPPRSRHITKSVYNGFFEWALRQDRIELSPMRKVEKITALPQQRKDIFTEVERAQLEALPSPDGALWTILFGTGLRKGEARRLRRRDIDLERARLLVIASKGNKSRPVPLPPAVMVAVGDLDLLERLEPHEYLWYLRQYPVGDHRRHRDPIGDTTFSRGPNDPQPGWYERGIRAAGVRYLNPHQTRHTYGVWLREKGELTLQERALAMGHADTRTTERYDRLTIDDLAEKIARL